MNALLGLPHENTEGATSLPESLMIICAACHTFPATPKEDSTDDATV